ncbi:PepSY domain-containing protein [Rhodococcus koreensis]
MRINHVRLAAVAVGVAVAIGTGVAVASSGDQETPITGDALTKASAAALAHTGGGTVTGTEIGDEESLYEVEVTLPDGNQVDVQLDQNFTVVGTKTDGPAADDGAGVPDNDGN